MSELRIGVIGVPGSGKSRFASAIKKAMPDKNFAIIDGYVDKLSRKLEMAVGVEATYLPNLHIASAREQEIRRYHLEDRNFVLCGTIFDTLCYAGFHSEIIASSAGDQDEKTSVLAREISAAQTFAYMCVDTYSQFTHLFYLPVTDPELLVAVSNRENPDLPPTEVEAMDKTIQDALRRYGNPATILKGKHSKNVEDALEILKSGNNGPSNNEAAVAGE